MKRGDTEMSEIQIKVAIRAPGKSGPIKAYADARLIFPDGELHLIGFAIIKQPGKSEWVAFPQNHGQSKYFPVVEAKGRIGDALIRAILGTYQESTWPL